MVVRGARCLAGWLLCLVDTTPECARQERRRPFGEGACELPCKRPNLRRAAGLARRAGGRGVMRPAPDRTADAPTGFESKTEATAPAIRHRRAIHERDLAESAGSHLRSPFCEPQMGRRLHIHMDRRGLALRGNGRRSLL